MLYFVFTADAGKRICLALLLLLLAACGGGSSSSSNVTPPVVQPSITVTPKTALVSVGTSAQFFAVVANSSSAAVNWSASVGTIDQSGNYIGPASVPNGGLATVTATSVSAPSVSALATITISSQPVTLSISPPTATVKAGFRLDYTALVGGTSNTTVTWAANDLPGDDTYPGSIVAGDYTAPSPLLAADTYSITATSVADPSKTASATVTAIPLENQEQQTFPIALGASGVNANTQDCCSGTLGSLLVDQKGKQYILSNNHVMGRVGHAVAGEAIVQPGFVDTFCDFSTPKTVANFTAAPPINSGVDAAIAQVLPGAVDPAGNIIGLGGVNPDGSYISAPPANSIATAAVDMAVAKSGRTTGLSCGFVEGISGTVLVDYPAECGNPSAGTAAFTNQVIVNDIVSPGDSGSLIVDAATAQPVALVSASSADGLFSTGNPAGDILAALTATTGSTFAFVGGAQHPVSCSATSQSSIQSSSRGWQRANPPAMPPLAREEVLNAIAVQSRHQVEIMRNPSVIGVAVSRSQSDSKRAALLVFVERGRNLPSLPTQIEGVAVQVILTGRFISGARASEKQRTLCGLRSPGRNN